MFHHILAQFFILLPLILLQLCLKSSQQPEKSFPDRLIYFYNTKCCITNQKITRQYIGNCSYIDDLLVEFMLLLFAPPKKIRFHLAIMAQSILPHQIVSKREKLFLTIISNQLV